MKVNGGPYSSDFNTNSYCQSLKTSGIQLPLLHVHVGPRFHLLQLRREQTVFQKWCVLSRVLDDGQSPGNSATYHWTPVLLTLQDIMFNISKQKCTSMLIGYACAQDKIICTWYQGVIGRNFLIQKSYNFHCSCFEDDKYICTFLHGHRNVWKITIFWDVTLQFGKYVPPFQRNLLQSSLVGRDL